MTLALRVVLGIGAIFCNSCSNIPVSEKYSGIYVSKFEVSEFKVRDKRWVDQKWWLFGNLQEVLDKCQKSKVPTECEPMYIEVIGRLSRKGSYGHLGQYDRELNVEKVLYQSFVLPK